MSEYAPYHIDTSKVRLVACVGGPLDGDAIVTPLDARDGDATFRVSRIVDHGRQMFARYVLVKQKAHGGMHAEAWRFDCYVCERAA